MSQTVSYVMAAFNTAETIAPAVQSALDQTDAAVEVVVVDDASSDDTVEAVQSLGDPRVRLVRLEQNQGPAEARNAGLEAATGDWVAVLDSDDALLPWRTRRLLDRAADAGADIVVDNLLTVHEQIEGPGQPLFSTEIFRQPSSLTLAEFVAGNSRFDKPSAPAYGYLKPMIRRSVIADNGIRYRPDLRIGEDFYFLAAAMAHGGAAATEPSAGYRYLQRPGSISRGLDDSHLLGMLNADADFVRDHQLDADAKGAFAERSSAVEDLLAFRQFRESVRSRDPLLALRAVAARPTSLRHLRVTAADQLARLRPTRS
ncbi:glycosyltransferase family 2 protein [Actinomycetota bacterium]